MKHAANLAKEKKEKKHMVMNESPEKRYYSNDASDGINTSLSSNNLNEDESTEEKSKCNNNILKRRTFCIESQIDGAGG